MNLLRVWDEARTSHFEILAGMQESTLIYRAENYSFDLAVALEAGAKKLGRWATVKEIIRGDWDAIELNEPTMAKLWPTLALYIFAARLRPLVGRPRSRLVLYAIDNVDLAACLEARLHLPTVVTHTIMRGLIRRFDRIAFGTTGALEAYSKHDSSLVSNPNCSIIEQLPSACGCGPVSAKVADSILFVSSLEERKGVAALMQAWDAKQSHRAHLTIIGKGAMESVVRDWARSRSDVTVLVDPPRADVHAALRSHHTVVLPSQPQNCWREQVGLPIVEGLAHGCVIVTTSETGIAEWLSAHGHHVVPPLDNDNFRAAMMRALDDPRSPQEILSSLPARHTRGVADEWLTA